jgi:hypothetical protein
MSHDSDSKLTGKLTLAVCMAAAKFGMPRKLQPDRILQWINNPDALSKKMHGLLSFLEDEPESMLELDLVRVEMTMSKMVPMRTAGRYLSEFARCNIELDPFFTEDLFSSELKPLGKSPVIVNLTAICFDREVNSAEVDEALGKVTGSIPASLGQLAEAALEVPGFIQHLGLVVATGGKFPHNGNLLAPYLAVGKESETRLMLGASDYEQKWPQSTWFLGISSLN